MRSFQAVFLGNLLISLSWAGCLTQLKDFEIAERVKSPNAVLIHSFGNTAQRVVDMGNGYVGRVAKNTPINRNDLNEAMDSSRDLPPEVAAHSSPVERIVEDGGDIIAVSRKAPGKQLELSPEAKHIKELSEASQEQFDTLVRTVVALKRRKLNVDFSPDNLFYDPHHGFHVIDLNNTIKETRPIEAADIAVYLTNNTDFITHPTDSTYKFLQEEFGWNPAHIKTLGDKIRRAIATASEL